MEQRLKGGKEKDNFPYLNASRKPRNVGLVSPRLTNVGLVGLLAAIDEAISFADDLLDGNLSLFLIYRLALNFFDLDIFKNNIFGL